jgi:glycosyltransferase involved in cell wall biosynthesis
MRILHLGKFYPPERGGIESYTRALCEWSAAQGHAVAALVHQAPGTARTTREMLDGVDVRRVACLGSLLYTPLSPTLPIELARTLREFEPDLLHLHLPNPSCLAVLAGNAARRRPWIVHWHAEVPVDAPDWKLRAAYRAYRPFEQALLKRAHAIVTTSQPYLDASPALAPWRDKTRVIPLGVADVSPSPPRDDLWPAGNGMRVLAVGRLSHYKGFDVLIDALAKTPDARVLLVGEGECAESLGARATERGVAARIRFAGGLDDATLLAAYASADVFALPSLNRGEAFGMVLLEAMRAGLPIVASAIHGSGVGEVVADRETGFLVKPGEPDALADALGKLGDAALRARLGDAGRARFERRFTLERSAEQWLALYRELTA